MGDAHAPARFKRCASEPSLHADEKRPRSCGWPAPPPPTSRSSEELTADHGCSRSCASHLAPQLQTGGALPAQEDPRDLLQVTLDQICELQRSLQSPHADAHASDYEADDDSDGEGTDSGEECGGAWDRQVVLAGFELCSKEALRFLVEEERLGAGHPAVKTLSAHLSARSHQLDCRRVLLDYLRRRDTGADADGAYLS
ncbi:uncharacterized protein LOC126335180 isoform X1 [Schistocerca gregaria]|uniref:uncharacterized protein LOC126335180 isoform X1 n=1 Tax=Schistocerca gregaria TaxID=7010 RepID=UPI00211E28CC|nr:uncharacterized protein LOC126335180 isoform X1 [Schistocerca gregaria]